MSDPLIKN